MGFDLHRLTKWAASHHLGIHDRYPSLPRGLRSTALSRETFAVSITALRRRDRSASTTDRASRLVERPRSFFSILIRIKMEGGGVGDVGGRRGNWTVYQSQVISVNTSFSEGKPENTSPTSGKRYSENWTSMKIRINICDDEYRNLSFCLFCLFMLIINIRFC